MDPLIRTGQAAPDFSLKSLGGVTYRLSEHLGPLIILNFWSAECTWSEQGDREILEALPAWGGRAILWTIASNGNEPARLVNQEAQRRGLPLVLLDEEHRVADLYGAQTTPHSFVIDSTRRLRYQGSINDITFRQRTATRSYLKEAISALLAGKNPQPDETPPYGCTIVRYLE